MAKARLSVEVRWTNIERVTDAQLFMCGHYANVVPQAAELALDTVVSAEGAEPNDDVNPRTIHSLTQRGMIRGAVGDVHLYPWAEWAIKKYGFGDCSRPLVGLAGMGFLGTFGVGELRRLARSVVFALERLPDVKRVATVLIGAGNGNIELETAVGAYLRGVVEALEKSTTSKELTLIFAELHITKALRLESAVKKVLRRWTDTRGARPFDFEEALLESGEGKAASRGAIGEVDAAMLAMLQVVRMVRDEEADGASLERSDAFFKSIDKVLRRDDIGSEVRKKLRERRWSDDGKVGDPIPDDVGLLKSLEQLELRWRASGTRMDFPTRMSVVRERVATTGVDVPSSDEGRAEAERRGGALTAIAAITDTTVTPKRFSALDWGLIREAADKLRDPDPAKLPKLARTLGRLILPRDFREFIDGEAPLIVEVDRATAVIPWEMMIAIPRPEDDQQLSLGLLRQLSRQLRTEYSPPPANPPLDHDTLRALVIGDPGSPARGESLEGARNEAIAVRDLLASLGVDVTAMIGAPSDQRSGKGGSTRPASRLEVLAELMDGGYDILHYAGHGSFDPDNPTRSGWLFEDGLLTSLELAQVDLAPQLVFANACVTGRTSGQGSAGVIDDGRRDFDLLPALADEFFRRGVRNYIGTAWKIDDEGAVQFADRFYRTLLGTTAAVGDGHPPAAATGQATIGASLLAARQEVAAPDLQLRALWAAYHHYGDPTTVLRNRKPTRPDAERPTGEANGGKSAAARDVTGPDAEEKRTGARNTPKAAPARKSTNGKSAKARKGTTRSIPLGRPPSRRTG